MWFLEEGKRAQGPLEVILFVGLCAPELTLTRDINSDSVASMLVVTGPSHFKRRRNYMSHNIWGAYGARAGLAFVIVLYRLTAYAASCCGRKDR